VRELKQKRAIVTRERIIRTAARLFALKGYHDTKIEEVIGKARVTTGAFFHHFKSKEDLGFAVIDAHMEKRRHDLERIERRMLNSGVDGNPLGALMRRLDAIEEMVRQREKHKGGCIIGNLSTALSDTHGKFRQRLAECFDQMALEFKPCLEVAAKKYRPRSHFDTWTIARYLVGMVEGSIMLARTRRDSKLIGQNFYLAKDHIKSLLHA
jgi:TetR/AcrR family transcriptional regulator, transcriptional repressor for nem operon